MSDTQPTQPLPDPHAQWVLSTSASASTPRRRRRGLPWIIAALVVVVLAVAAWFVGEAIARDVVSKTIRDQVVTRLALPADQPVDVQVEGVVIPQLIGGSLSDVHIASDDVTLGALTGDVVVDMQGLPIRDGGKLENGTATVTIDQTQLQGLLATVGDFPAATVALAEPNLTVSTDIQVLGISLPVGVALRPTASDGDIMLRPESLEVAGARLSASDLEDRFGALADAVVRDWNVCIAQYVPAGVVLQQVDVVGETVVARLGIDGGIITDPALQANGTCS